MKYSEGKPSTRKIGMDGERMARHFFEDLGFDILEMNWRHKHQEIDIIAFHKKTLHFIEVKTQRSDLGGLPEESVHRKKLLNVMKAAEAYMLTHDGWETVQYDILSIILRADGSADIVWIEDVYV